MMIRAEMHRHGNELETKDKNGRSYFFSRLNENESAIRSLHLAVAETKVDE
jgi:hypothetical protein